MKETAAHEEQDGNASSQTTKSNPSSFARATGKPGSEGGKRGKAAAASRQPRRKRSTANKPRPTQLRRKEEGTHVNTILCIANHVGVLPIPIHSIVQWLPSLIRLQSNDKSNRLYLAVPAMYIGLTLMSFFNDIHSLLDV